MLAQASDVPSLVRQFGIILLFSMLFLTALGLCPLYREAAAAPFSQSHCKQRNNWEKLGVLERRVQAPGDCISTACATSEVLQQLPCAVGQRLWCPSVRCLACVGQGTAPCSFITMAIYSLSLVLAFCVSAATEESPSQ